MSVKRSARRGFSEWADAVLAGTGWTARTVRGAVLSERDDLATVALADGFATAMRNVDHADTGGEGDGL